MPYAYQTRRPVVCSATCFAVVAVLVVRAAAAQNVEPATYRGNHPVEAVSASTLICEAEEFQPAENSAWRARPWGTNYYAATFANSFLSRKAYLGAPEQCEASAATIEVRVPAAGRYLALVRYEAAFRYETQFRLLVEQVGAARLDRIYGARANPKVWAFSQKVQSEVSWPWGAVENVVWEGHDAYVDLQAGTARLTLTAGPQPDLAARRNVDLVLLTSDLAQVQSRIDKESYLPLDGMLTQAGDVHLKLHNHADGAAMTLAVGNGTEHSPYWVHQRQWEPRTIAAAPGESTDWIEVGSLLDTLNDGQWELAAKADAPLHYDVEIGVRSAAGEIAAIRRFADARGNLSLAYQADTRYSRQVRTADDILYDLVAYLKSNPVHGTPLQRTLVYGYTFTRQPGNDRYNAAIDEFTALTGATALSVGSGNEIPLDGPLVRGYIDLRSVPTPELEAACQKLQVEGKASRVAVVSLGDEIGLAPPPADDHAGFRGWLAGQGLAPSDLDPAFGNDWNLVAYTPAAEMAAARPALYYYSKIYGYRYGIGQIKARTDILRRHLPQVGIGANFSPHHGHLYMGETHHWISLFREQGMTMPWGEDYIWQVPVGTQQMNSLVLDMYRAGIRGRPEAKIHYYVMPHWPGNTPDSWRRQFYGTLAHGAKVLNLFEFRPVQAAYTENHCSLPAMYQEVRQGLHELGTFEDIVQDGQVRAAAAGLWCSEAADVWNDNRAPFDVAKRTLYIALRHQQMPVDIVVDGDDLSPYKLVVITDQHVSRAAAKALSAWVEAGGNLLATAGAGMWDELNQPNLALRELLGVEQQSLEEAAGEPIRFEKQDLPFATPVAELIWQVTDRENRVPLFGARSRFTVTTGAAFERARFAGGEPAIVIGQRGKGRTAYLGYLPGLSYFQPAIPQRPVDRGSTDDSMAHFIPTAFDATISGSLALLAGAVERPVVCSEPLVETTVIEAPQGTVIPLINWSGQPVQGLQVELDLAAGAQAALATGGAVKQSERDGKRVFTLDLDVADALILRN